MNFRKLKPGERQRWLIECARSVLEAAGYQIERVPGTRRSVVWRLRRDDVEKLVSVRTTADRWFAFNRSGDGWKPLDDVDDVVVSAVDDVDDPRNAQIHYFPGDAVRERLEEACAARISAGQRVRDNFGFWIALDRRDDRDAPTRTGSGIGEDHPPIGVIPLDPSLRAEAAITASNAPTTPTGNATIAERKFAFAAEVAAIAGVSPDKVVIDIRILG